MTKRIAIRIVLIIVVVVMGFVYLLRSCLSKFDERAAIGGGSSQSASQFLVFEKEGRAVIFSLVQYDKTTSYSQKGGSTTRSVKRTYYAQSNDLATAAKLDLQKIKTGNQIKAYPIELLGAAGDKAWLFAGELMAYDPFTLQKLADAAIIEEKNPALKGKLINERRFYTFDYDKKAIRITAADGQVYDLNTSTLIAGVTTGSGEDDNNEQRIKELEKQVKKLREVHRAAYDRLRNNNLKYQQKQLPVKDYKDSADRVRAEVSILDRQIDSLEDISGVLKEEQRNKDSDKDRRTNARRTGAGFSGMKTNADTMKGRWYGLFTPEDLDKYGDRFEHRQVYNENARNKLYTAAISLNSNRYWTISDDKTDVSNQVYLQGGFFLDKETGLPFHSGEDFLIVYKDRIGNDGVVQLARIRKDGRQLWSINTGLKDFHDWQLRGNKLVITGTDNKNLGSGETNLLQIIDLQNGGRAAYDFFTDKQRTAK